MLVMCTTCSGAPVVVHHRHAHRNVAHAHAVVNERMAFAFRIPGIHVGGAGFEFERSGDSVMRLKFIVARFLAVFM